MTKANMMKEAHRLAKTYEGNYTACLALALRTLNSESFESCVEDMNSAVLNFFENNTKTSKDILKEMNFEVKELEVKKTEKMATFTMWKGYEEGEHSGESLPIR